MTTENGALPELPDRLCGADLTLVVPSRPSEKWAIVMAMNDIATSDAATKPTHVVLAAALGLCWARLRPRVQWKGDVLDFGSRVIDALLDPGVKYRLGEERSNLDDIVRAGVVAVRMIRENTVTADQIKAARDFSKPPLAGSSESGSPSSAGGGGTSEA